MNWKNGVSFSLIKVIDKLNDLIATKRPIISPRTSKLHKVISNCLVIILGFFTRLMLLREVWLFVVCTFFYLFSHHFRSFRLIADLFL